MTDQVLAAIDSSPFSEGVCDYAAWVAQALNTPLFMVGSIIVYRGLFYPPFAMLTDCFQSRRRLGFFGTF